MKLLDGLTHRRRQAAIAALARGVSAPEDAPALSLIGSLEDPPGGVEVVAGVAEARGDFVVRLHPGDRADPAGLTLIRAALAAAPGARMLFTDEQVAGGELILKPAYDPVLREGLDYVSRFAVLRRDDVSVAESSDWAALTARIAERTPAERILHLPWPALIRAAPPEAPAAQAAIAPMRDHRISVIIPNRDSPDLIRRVLAGVLEETAHPDLEVIVVDNGSSDPVTLSEYRARDADPRVRIDIDPAPFNFSAMVNRGIALSTGDQVLLLNNDIEVEDPGWLSEMSACLERPGTGIVGARLLYPDRSLQHAGVVVGWNGRAEHLFKGAPEDTPGPLGMLGLRRSVSVVTGAAMLISRGCLNDLGAWNETDFAVAYNDVDYCLRARARGWGVTFTPHATLIHHEGRSRRKDAGARARFRAELAALRRLHGTGARDDPAASPWWSRRHLTPRVRPPAVPPAARRFMDGVAVAGEEPQPVPQDG